MRDTKFCVSGQLRHSVSKGAWFAVKICLGSMSGALILDCGGPLLRPSPPSNLGYRSESAECSPTPYNPKRQAPGPRLGPPRLVPTFTPLMRLGIRTGAGGAMLKVVYLRPRRDWAPTIEDINRAVQAAVRLRRALWALADLDAEYVGFEGNTLSGALTRILRL